MELIAIDFEYSSSNNEHPNLVCFAYKTSGGDSGTIWLHKDAPYSEASKKIHELCKDRVIVSYNAVAEGRCFLALSLDPLKYKWVDLFLEYRQLLNHNYNLMYGRQLIKGKVRTTTPPIKPKWQRTEEEERNNNYNKPEASLASSLFKMLNVKIDTDFKGASRDLIVSNPKEFTEDERKEILEYCLSDVVYLIPLTRAIFKEAKRLLGKKYNNKEFIQEMYYRANYSLRSAKMESLGYPVSEEKMRNFSNSVMSILYECQTDIIKQFPDNPPFHRTKKGVVLYSMHQKAIKTEIKKWLRANPRKRWIKTKTGELSLSLDAFKRHFKYSHNYPRGHYFAQVIRYLTLKQNMNGFSPTSKNTIWDSVGDDGRVRPYMGIYGAQSSRSQPKATSFIPLKSAWMRSLIHPPEGYVCFGIDYSSEEFIIGALESEDERMLATYASGDVYLGFLKDAKQIPSNATKQTHSEERERAKPIILGLQFDMTEVGLSQSLTESWGRRVSEAEALKWIHTHKRSYPTLWAWKEKIQREYRINKYIKLRDGWYMWGDNPNFRSVGNVPIQGMGACIMRKAVELAQERGLDIIYTLHDALYGISKIEKFQNSVSILSSCMDEAFRWFYRGEKKLRATCRMEADVWGDGLEVGELDISYSTLIGDLICPTTTMPIFIDPRGREQYEQFKKFFYRQEKELDLGF